MGWEELIRQINFINLGAAVLLPLSFIGLDFLTGFVNALIKHEVSSSKMREGGGKKFGELVCICVALLGVAFIRIPAQAVYAVSAYICLMELISIYENIKLLGVTVPGALDHKVDNLKHDISDPKSDKEDE